MFPGGLLAQPAADALAEAHLVSCIHESLGLFLFDNAKFLGERLVALHNSEVRWVALVCRGGACERRAVPLGVACKPAAGEVITSRARRVAGRVAGRPGTARPAVAVAVDPAQPVCTLRPVAQANQQLLATCYLQCNQAYRSYHLLKGVWMHASWPCVCGGGTLGTEV